MPKLSEIRTKRNTDSYHEIFGDAGIAAIFARIQSAAQRSDNDLLQVIQQHAEAAGSWQTDLQQFLTQRPRGVSLTGKAEIRQSGIAPARYTPDFLIMDNRSNAQCYAIIMHDSTRIEPLLLSQHANLLREFASAAKMTIGSPITTVICEFPIADRPAIEQAQSQLPQRTHIWTGPQFCRMARLSHQAIVEQLTAHAAENQEWLAQELLYIPELRRLAQRQLERADMR